MKYLLLTVFIFISSVGIAQVFNESPHGGIFEDVHIGSITFSDVDNDNDEDLLITGLNNSGVKIAILYKNIGQGNFSIATGIPFEGVTLGSVAFSDVDNDNDNDLLITGGTPGSGDYLTKLYKNDGEGGFSEVLGTDFENVTLSSVAFSDVDNDNDEDLLITGLSENLELVSKLYINDGNGIFSESTSQPFVGVDLGAIAFSDVDGDNDQDVLITGIGLINNLLLPIAKLYINNSNGIFIESQENQFEGVAISSVAFSDVDGDGDGDVLIAGENELDNPTAKLYLNDGNGSFTESQENVFDGVKDGSVAFSDVDGDNDQDIVITGNGLSTSTSTIYLNDGIGNYSRLQTSPFIGVMSSSISFSDIDLDGDEDILIAGRENSGINSTRLYINNSLVSSSSNILEKVHFELVLYPNPSLVEEVNLNIISMENCSILTKIFNMNGHLLFQQENSVTIGMNVFSINTTRFKKGTYILELFNGTSRMTKKLLIQ